MTGLWGAARAAKATARPRATRKARARSLGFSVPGRDARCSARPYSLTTLSREGGSGSVVALGANV